MRGSPLLRALAAFLVILSLGYPLWRLTGNAEPAPTPVAAPVAVAPRAVTLRLTFTMPPTTLRVRHLGAVIMEVPTPPGESEHQLELVYPEQGVDLLFEIDWPADAPLAALRVRLTDPAGEEHEKSIWGQGPMNEVLTFP